MAKIYHFWMGVPYGTLTVQAFLKKWWVESDFKAPNNLPCHINK